MQQGFGTRSLIKKEKRMDECGIRKYVIAEEKNMNAENFTMK
jgi:hypothetical protein